MAELAQLDQVAYVRFASVYRHFRDVQQFVDTIRSLVPGKGTGHPEVGPRKDDTGSEKGDA
jgi:transcriptional repressor NrdR